MKYYIYYISNHGFGHLTRCLAHIENLLEKTNYNVYIACGKKQNDFARLYLAEYNQRIIYSDVETDIGFVNKANSLEVDKEKLQEKLFGFITHIDTFVEIEINKLQSMDFDQIHVDISPLGILIAKKLNKKVVMTTNFTWYSQYKHLDLDDKILQFYKYIDLQVDVLKKYPLHFGMDYFICESEQVDFICRKIDYNKVNDIKKQFGKSIMVSVGRSAVIDEIEILNFNGTIFYTEGVKIKSDANLVKLSLDILDTQNYIAAADFVITKAGWGTIAECMISHTPMILIERPTAVEDTHNIKEIIRMKKGVSVTEKDLKKIEVDKYEQRLKDLCSWT